MKEALIEILVKGWGKRQLLKGLAILSGIIGANAESVPDVAAFIIAGVLYLTEMLFSAIARRRLEAEAAAARLENTSAVSG